MSSRWAWPKFHGSHPRVFRDEPIDTYGNGETHMYIGIGTIILIIILVILLT